MGLGAAAIDAGDLKTRLALKTLLMPGGLGSTHKVMIFAKDVGTPALPAAHSACASRDAPFHLARPTRLPRPARPACLE